MDFSVRCLDAVPLYVNDVEKAADFWIHKLKFEANAAFPHPSKPLAAVATYITQDGRILNARIIQPNLNSAYNATCLAAINSLDGNLQTLQFPPGSHRMTVDKATTFTQQ